MCVNNIDIMTLSRHKLSNLAKRPTMSSISTNRVTTFKIFTKMKWELNLMTQIIIIKVKEDGCPVKR